MKSLKDQGLRRCEHESSYFRGSFNKYGKYQWDIKFYGFNSDYEIELAQNWAFGEKFEYLSEIIGRPVKAHIAGRSGGWLVIDTDLYPDELNRIDEHVNSCMAGLKDFLKDERQYQSDIEREEQEQENRTRAEVMSEKRVRSALKLLESYAGQDIVLMVKGIKVK